LTAPADFDPSGHSTWSVRDVYCRNSVETPLAASNSKLQVPAPVTVGQPMPWRPDKFRVRPALSTA